MPLGFRLTPVEEGAEVLYLGIVGLGSRRIVVRLEIFHDVRHRDLLDEPVLASHHDKSPGGGLCFLCERSFMSAVAAFLVLIPISSPYVILLQMVLSGLLQCDLQCHESVIPQGFAYCQRSYGKLVGAEGFEPSTFCTRNKRATRLRYAPT